MALLFVCLLLHKVEGVHFLCVSRYAINVASRWLPRLNEQISFSSSWCSVIRAFVHDRSTASISTEEKQECSVSEGKGRPISCKLINHFLIARFLSCQAKENQMLRSFREFISKIHTQFVFYPEFVSVCDAELELYRGNFYFLLYDLRYEFFTMWLNSWEG